MAGWDDVVGRTKGLSLCEKKVPKGKGSVKTGRAGDPGSVVRAERTQQGFPGPEFWLSSTAGPLARSLDGRDRDVRE